MAEKEPEFGKGLTYCIGLFLEHAGRTQKDIEAYKKAGLPHFAEMWFNGSSDHLYEIDTSAIKDVKLKSNIEAWRAKVIHWGHGFTGPKATEKDVFWSVKQAKKFLQEIDEKLLNIKTIKGSYE